LHSISHFSKSAFPDLINKHDDTITVSSVLFWGFYWIPVFPKKSVVRKLSTLRSFYKFLVSKKIPAAKSGVEYCYGPKVEKKLPAVRRQRIDGKDPRSAEIDTFGGARDSVMFGIILR